MNPKWLTPELQLEVRKVFEPRYKRYLTDEEVSGIAMNLTSYMEVILKHNANVNANDNTRPRVS
jgi:hypothetical protein